MKMLCLLWQPLDFGKLEDLCESSELKLMSNAGVSGSVKGPRSGGTKVGSSSGRRC